MSHPGPSSPGRPDHPGHPGQHRLRALFRVLAVLLPVGVVMAGWGFYTFATTEPTFESTLPAGLGAFALGGLLAVVGLLFANLGFMGAAARYSAGETAPVLRDSLDHVTGSGRSAAGPYCRACGVRNDDDARFCDACGTPVA